MVILMLQTFRMTMTRMMLTQAAWWVEYVCRHGTANWLKSIGEEVVKMLVMMVVMMVTMMAMTMVVIGNKEICRQCVNYFFKNALAPSDCL